MDSSETQTAPSRATDRILQGLSTLAALLDRTINEVRALEDDFHKRAKQSVQEAEAALQSQAAHHLEGVVTEARTKLEERFASKVSELSSQWEEERNRLNAELSKMTQNAVQWEAERARLNGELERLARVQAATQAEAEKAIIAMKASSAGTKNSKRGPSANNETLTQEMDRVDRLIKEISEFIEDPAADLSMVIRKNVERAGLESYLKGIRFALSGNDSN
jgi:chromosome segregation ATPase